MPYQAVCSNADSNLFHDPNCSDPITDMSDNLLQMCPSLDVSQTETPLWNYEKIQPIQQICNHSQEMCKQQLIRGDEVLNMCILYDVCSNDYWRGKIGTCVKV